MKLTVGISPQKLDANHLAASVSKGATVSVNTTEEGLGDIRGVTTTSRFRRPTESVTFEVSITLNCRGAPVWALS